METAVQGPLGSPQKPRAIEQGYMLANVVSDKLGTTCLVMTDLLLWMALYPHVM